MNENIDTSFTYQIAIDYEPGITRRDPSPVIKVGPLYYVWYTRATVDASGYYGSVWCASSPDGHAWTERGEAIPTGPDGTWDSNGVFTPTTLVTPDAYYLFYTAVPKPFDNDNGGPNGTHTAIGAAVSSSPDGPWQKIATNPLLQPGTGDELDTHRVDDACFIVRDGKYWMYYKGRQKGLSPAQTRMFLAQSNTPTGPYKKSPLNPIIDSGHEVCVWPHGNGIAAILSPTGPQGSTLQYSSDGLHFSKTASIHPGPPSAPGPYRTDNYTENQGPGITWGLCQDVSTKDRPFLLRFDCHMESRNK